MLRSKLQSSLRINAKKASGMESPIDVREYLFAKMKEEVLGWLDSAKDEILGVVDKVVSEEIKDLRAKELKNIKKGDKGERGEDSRVAGPEGKMGPQGPQGVQGLQGIEGKEGKVGRSGPKGEKGMDGSSDTALEIVSKINTLENTVKINVIENLEGILATMHRNINSISKGKYMRGGGDVVEAGSNVTITRVNGRRRIASSGGSGFTTLDATETPNGILTVFTFSSASAQPTYVISDNVWLRAVSEVGTVNWTWSAGLKQATLAVPSLDDIWAVV